jgi:hypothetical protein
MNIYAIHGFQFKISLVILTVTGMAIGTLLAPNRAEAYQEASTPTGAFITVANPPDGTNVRSGPSSVAYGPPIGHLNPGATAPAIGTSPGGEWIQIEFPSAPTGVGWVYTANVVVAGGDLRIVEPPPTPAPLITATIDPTLAAAFNIQPTQTRIPTFTPPPPLEVPQFADGNTSHPVGAAFGIFILMLVVLGGVGLALSYVLRS